MALVSVLEGDAPDPATTAPGLENETTAALIELARAQNDELIRLRDWAARRAPIERAKGILMARLGIGEERAYQLLRRHARRSSRPLSEIALSVTQAHLLLVAAGDDESRTMKEPRLRGSG